MRSATAAPPGRRGHRQGPRQWGPWTRVWACLLGLMGGWIGVAALATAQGLLAVPPLTGRVVDTVALLEPPQRAMLESQLAAFEAERGSQIVVLVVGSTAPEDLPSFAQRVGDAWKLGRPGVGDGLLVLLARDDRRVWIATSKALEGAVPDLAAREIIRTVMTPAFRNGEFAGGLSAGLEALMVRIRAEGLPLPPAPRTEGSPSVDNGHWLEDAALFFFVGVPVISMLMTTVFGRRLGALLTAGARGGLAWWWSGSLVVSVVAGVLALVLVGVLGVGALMQQAARGGLLGRASSGGGGARGRRRGDTAVIWGGGTGGWGGGGGGGGFSSGGGGDFGGGGAGGDW